MRIIDRILLLLFGLAALAGAIFVGLLTLGALGDATNVVPVSTYPDSIYVLVGAAIFALLALRFIFYRWGSSEPNYVLLSGENGQIRISHEAIQQLANRSGRSIRGVQEFASRVRSEQSGIVLAVRVKALPDLDLAKMSTDVQNAVKEYVEKTAGVTVERISVSVTELAINAPKTAKAWVD